MLPISSSNPSIRPQHPSIRFANRESKKNESALHRVFSYFLQPFAQLINRKGDSRLSSIQHVTKVESSFSEELLKTLIETHLAFLLQLNDQHASSVPFKGPLSQMIQEGMAIDDQFVQKAYPLSVLKQNYYTLKAKHENQLKALGIYSLDLRANIQSMLSDHLSALLSESERYLAFPEHQRKILPMIETTLDMQSELQLLNQEIEIRAFSERVKRKINIDQVNLAALAALFAPSAPPPEAFMMDSLTSSPAYWEVPISTQEDSGTASAPPFWTLNL